MNRLKFIFSMGINSLLRRKSIFYTLVLAHIIGFLAPFIVIGFATSIYTDLNESKIQNIESTALFSFDDTDFNKKNLMKEFSFIKRITALRPFQSNIVTGSKYTLATTVLTDADYDEFFKLHIDGSFYTSDQVSSAASLCVIGEELAKELFDQESPLGSNLIMNSKTFKVIGVTKNRNMQRRVLAPITSFDKSELVNYRVIHYIQMKSILDDIQIEQIENSLIRNNIEYNYMKMTDYFSSDLNQMNAMLILFLTISIGFTIFVILNISNILFIFIESEKQDLGVKIISGASFKDLLLEKSIGLFICAAIATLIIIILLLLSFRLAQFGVSVRTSLILICSGLILVGITTVAESLILLKKLKKKKAIRLINS